MGPVFSFGRALPDTLTATLTVCGWENRLQITEKGSVTSSPTIQGRRGFQSLPWSSVPPHAFA